MITKDIAMECDTHQHGDTVRFLLKGKVDESGAELLNQRFNQLQLSQVRELAIDMTACSYIGSSGIGKLLLFYKHLASHDGTLRLENVPPATCELLRELKLDTLFAITPA